MSIDLTNKEAEMKYNGETITAYLGDMGDVFIIPSKARIDALTPIWNEHHLTSKQVYCVVRECDEHAIETLNSIGFTKEAYTWLGCGYAVNITCIAPDMLESMLYSYNGIMQ